MKNRLGLLVDGEKKMRSKKPRDTSRPWMLQHTGKAPRRGITGTTKKTTQQQVEVIVHAASSVPGVPDITLKESNSSISAFPGHIVFRSGSLLKQVFTPWNISEICPDTTISSRLCLSLQFLSVSFTQEPNTICNCVLKQREKQQSLGLRIRISVLKHIIVLKPPRQYSAPAENMYVL